MYGKIIDGKLVLAPNPLVAGGYKIYNPTPGVYENNGYLKIVETDYPNDDKYYEKKYGERDGKIYGEWVETDAPEVAPAQPTEGERITALEETVGDLEEAFNMILEGVTE